MEQTTAASSAFGTEFLLRLAGSTEMNRWIYESVEPYLGTEIIEIGSGIGTISRMLPRSAAVVLTDIDERYLSHLAAEFSGRTAFSTRQLDIGAPAADGSLRGRFDTVLCINVLEHIENDAQAVANMSGFLKVNGTLVLLVPQYRFLYGSFDRALGHHRRYSHRTLRRLLESQGMAVVQSRNFNSFAILGWFLNACILKKENVGWFQIRMYDILVPLLKRIERRIPLPGMSIINVSRKL